MGFPTFIVKIFKVLIYKFRSRTLLVEYYVNYNRNHTKISHININILI